MSASNLEISNTRSAGYVANIMLANSVFAKRKKIITKVDGSAKATFQYSVELPNQLKFEGIPFEDLLTTYGITRARTEKEKLRDALALPMFCYLPPQDASDRLAPEKLSVAPVYGVRYQYVDKTQKDLKGQFDCGVRAHESQAAVVEIDMRLKLHNKQGAVLVWGSRNARGTRYYSMVTWRKEDCNPTLIRPLIAHPLWFYCHKSGMDKLAIMDACSTAVSKMFISYSFDF